MAFEVSLQLYTVRDALEGRFLEGIAEVAELGFKSVEFAGFGNSTALQAGKRLEELGMTASGAHVPLSILEDPEPILDNLRAIHCTQATLPWVPESMRTDWTDTARRLDDCAAMLHDHGVEFGYHNHAFEFENGGFAQLTEGARRVNFQLDVYWAEHAGESATTWIERLSGRMPSIHCKDMGADGKDIEIGSGRLDWPAILKAAEQSGVKTLVLEMDTPRMSPMDSARACLDGIRRFLQ